MKFIRIIMLFILLGDANVPLKQLKMRHSPAVLRSGTNFTVYTDGEQTSDSPLTNGVTTSRTSYLGIEVQVNRHSICDSIQGGCPVKKGPTLSISRESIPGIAPRGTYTVSTRSIDRDGKLISCVTWKFVVE